MFPRISRSNKKSGVYEYLVISESIHVKGKGSTTRDIANLGNVKKLKPNEIENLIDGLIRLFQVEKYSLSEQVEILESLEHGSIIFWQSLWNKICLSDLIKRLTRKKKSRVKIDVEKYIEMMVVNRCVDPHSKLGTTRWVERTSYKAMKGYHDLSLDVEYFYRSMDYLLAIKDELELELYERLKTLFSINVKLTFYDITSTFFHADNCSIAKKGYSRDHRSDKEQIVIGVVTSWEGYPIKHYVFDGNTKDEKTVIEVVKQLKEEYQIEETTFVGDRGMITKLNLSTIEGNGFKYIMGVKHRQSEMHAMLLANDELNENLYQEHKGLKIQERQILVKDFLLWKSKVVLNEKGIAAKGQAFSSLKGLIGSLNNLEKVEYASIKKAVLPLTKDSKICRKISGLIRKYNGQYENTIRSIICLNQERQVLARQKREAKISTLSESLTELFSKVKEETESIKVEKKIDRIFEGYKRRYKKFFIILRDQQQKAIGYTRNEETLIKEKKYDGIFIIATNRQDLEPSKVVDSYKNLQEVEMLFDDLKHFVDIHPVRHWLEVRVRAHVFLCILALLLKRIFEISCLNGKACMQPLEEISKSKLIKYEVKYSEKEDRRQIFPKVTQTTLAQKEIFKMVGIKNPMSLENLVW
ncbi:MAG: IS1634 family transposase [Desulfosarcina sp.]|nr:IS1634 family transposase [Desulfobacterales bacterium]